MSSLKINPLLLNRGKLLWENPDPNQEMKNSTITLKNSDYDMLLWMFKSDDFDGYQSEFIPKGENIVVTYTFRAEDIGWGQWIGSRKITYRNDTTFEISQPDGGFTNYNQHLNYGYGTKMIPVYVIGFKTCLFE